MRPLMLITSACCLQPMKCKDLKNCCKCGIYTYISYAMQFAGSERDVEIVPRL